MAFSQDMNSRHERSLNISRPREMAERGEEIYARKYKAEYEKKYFGKFLVIDLKSEKAYVGDSDINAYKAASQEAPDSLFYLIRIGFRAAHKMSGHAPANRHDWLYGS
jgi:hypothetical protein